MLRGVGLLLMVVDHSYDWWLVKADNVGTWGNATEFIGTLAAPTFFVLVGVSMSLATDSYLTRGMTPWETIGLFTRRGLTIGLWGYAVNLLVFFEGNNWRDLLAFDVLQCIGLSMVLFGPLAVVAPNWTYPLLALAAGWGGQFADRLELSGYLGTIINGSPPIAYFPLLPWLCFVPLGMVWGLALVRWREHRVNLNRTTIGLLLSGVIALIATTYVDPGLGYRHPYLISVLFDWTVITILNSLLYASCLTLSGRLALGWLRDMGQETLLLYIVHHLVGFRFFRLIGWVKGRSWRGQFGTMGVRQATLLLLGFVGILYLITRVWMDWKSKNPVIRKVSDALL